MRQLGTSFEDVFQLSSDECVFVKPPALEGTSSTLLFEGDSDWNANWAPITTWVRATM